MSMVLQPEIPLFLSQDKQVISNSATLTWQSIQDYFFQDKILSLSVIAIFYCNIYCWFLSRYGLYSSPFDPVLFDLEVSGSSCKTAFNSSIGVQSDEIDLSDILSGKSNMHSCIIRVILRTEIIIMVLQMFLTPIVVCMYVCIL